MQVRAVSTAGDGAWSGTATETPLSQTVPDAPSAPTVDAELNGDLDVSWSAPADGGATIEAYDLRYRIMDGGWVTVQDAWVTGGGSLAYTILAADLEAGESYDIQIRAANAVGDGAWSPSRTQTTDVNAPSAPDITALTPGDASLLTQWTAPTDDGGSAITSYDLRYRTSA